MIFQSLSLQACVRGRAIYCLLGSDCVSFVVCDYLIEAFLRGLPHLGMHLRVRESRRIQYRPRILLSSEHYSVERILRSAVQGSKVRTGVFLLSLTVITLYGDELNNFKL